MTVPHYMVGEYYGARIAPKGPDESEDDFVKRAVAELKANRLFVEANEILAGHRWDSEEADGTVEKGAIKDLIDNWDGSQDELEILKNLIKD